MRITTLIENTTAREDVRPEHGLSLYIETAQHRILFDMGQSELFAQNAALLGAELSAVDIAVLSHGHYDHGGGLRRFLDINSHAPVYIHEDAFCPHYNGTEKYIGLDTALQGHPRILQTRDSHRIGDGLTLLTYNGAPRQHGLDSAGLTEKVGERFLPDDFRHEQYLLIEENDKRVLISGCSHKGIRDIVRWTAPDVLIGGFHLSKLPLDGALEQIAKELAAYPTEFYTCHCTGSPQFEFMKRYIPKLHYLPCGTIINI